MSMILTITDAGRQALVNAQNTGTLPLVISHVALGRARYNPAKSQLALQDEVKRVVSFGGGAVAPDVIHITVHDDSTDSYPLGEFGLITSTGVLFAVYSKPAEYILEKNASGILLLSADTKITTLDITNIQFAGTNFILPPGTATVAGILRLADSNEATEGLNNSKAMTPKTTKEIVDQHKNAEAAHSWNQISNKPASYPATPHSHPWDQITNKPATYSPSYHGHTWDDIPTVPYSKLGFSYSSNATPNTMAHRDGNGNLYANQFVGSGSSLTGINANNVNAGTINDLHLPVTQSGKIFTSQLRVDQNAGATPEYWRSQLLVTDAESNLPVSIGLWRRQSSAIQLVHRANSSLELFGSTFGELADFTARDISSRNHFYFRPGIHTGGRLEGGVRSYAPGAYNYGMGVNNNAGGLEFHASQAGAGMHRFYTGDFNTAIERVRITGATYALEVTGNAKADAYYGNGSNLTNLAYSQLPYAAIQQGGGVGQTTAKIYIGSSGSNEVKCAVDSTDQGAFAFKPWVTTNFAANHPTASFTEAQVGGVSALRQWSPNLVKAAVDYGTSEMFGASKLNTLTLLAPAAVPNGQYVYWKVGKVAFAYYVIVVQAANQIGSVKIGAISSHFPLNSGSALVHASPTSHLRLELTRSGELMVHYNNVTGTYDGLHSWRTD